MMMMRAQVFYMVVFVLIWIGFTYLLFVQRPGALNARSSHHGTRLEPQLKVRLVEFETRLRQQIRDNAQLLREVQALHGGVEPAVVKFVDGANEYEAGGLGGAGLDLQAVPGGGTGGGPAESVRGSVGPIMPLLMFACNRVTVAQAVDLILAIRGDRVQKFPLIVSQDCGHKATRDVLLGYGDQIIFLEQPHQSPIAVPAKEKKFQGYFNIARHYGWALNHTFNELKYEQVIVVEDDLEIAPDFFEYFEATLPILKSDPSLYCVSAWNDNGKQGLIDQVQKSLLYRSDFFGGLGWMLTRELWRELSPKWPASYWDDWIRDPRQRRERACIRPEISRTKTFGKVGVSNGMFYDKHLKFIKLNDQFYDFTKADLSYLLKAQYDPAFEAKLNALPVVSVEELRSGEASGKHKARHGAVRLVYHTKLVFKKYAKVLGIMDDFKAGVPRMAYKGVVSTLFNGLRVYVSPAFSWKGYDPTW
ncbi:hypothetical protein TCAL_04948 [Tigriopus californicus]|uniref:Alpha-1,3-mannosyl-glycoprotein 2-beta-N-acetylglucosaminyltransferase n=1 Tax=Tigriopus californicus TaxID=6832 RepID=A0A553P9V2_TIGCA|nr:alpha-1,3-mannosyl-glycoprotein 2-beta-N-acetylglucosaminyltransferase-like [Tigriopus californicus]TRY74448.1 hypothetical protein TCAL_04948 [Tigriopus californicus]|eukprot:TCALIF_04948-PA protein Name:"Similar to Mgat1 Alpha-1,3-mannosyl-glycoprotein 2-beta-N-acetylglucosaminyltransferase (Rattus norvegicus)" AED:0.14 eAED:0.14 QI:192/1/1/1/1/1/2/684/474